MDGMLSLKEVMDYLELEQIEIEELVRRGRLNAYKIGGVFLRFRKDQIVDFKSALRKRSDSPLEGFFVKAVNYWSFNRIYILSAILFGLVVYVLFR